MLLVYPAQQGFVGGVVLRPFQRGIFLAQAVQRGGELYVILAIMRGDGHGCVAAGVVHRQPEPGLALAAQHHARLRGVELADRHDLAGGSGGLLGGFLALHGKQRAAAARFAPKFLALAQRAAIDAGIGQPPHRPALRDLDDMHAMGAANAGRRLLGPRSFVAQQL